MKIQCVNVSPYVTNCYILTIGNDVLVIDPGGDYDKIEPFLSGKNVLGTVITHGHDDHNSASHYFDKIYDFSNLNEGKNVIGPFNFEVIYTPGHTKDSITLYFDKEGVMFTGDFLFKGSIGRMDFEGGSESDMRSSLIKIRTYPDCKIYPGHGDFTTLNFEKENNIYFLSL